MSLYHLWIIGGGPAVEHFAQATGYDPRSSFPWVWTGPPSAIIYRAGHLLFAVVLVFLIYPLRSARGMGNPGLPDLAVLAIAVAVVSYPIVFDRYLTDRMPYVDDPTTLDLVVAAIGVVVVIEATRRVLGWALPLTAIVFLAYALLWAKIDWRTTLDQLYLTTEGIFGSTLQVSAAYVMVFVVFGAFMEKTGTGQLFMDFALSLTGRQAGGPGKVAVVSSSLFGTISGSAVANVMVDGPITIPLMKRTGFRPAFAAGVEAVASTGGQIMPPVMGAAAFVMAEFLRTSYFQITLWALIPALLYYVACFGAVHFEAKRRGLVGLPRAECPRLGAVLRERGHLFIPVAIILFMMFTGWSSPLAALVATLACFPVAMLRANTRAPLRAGMVLDALIEGAKGALSVAMACACAGIIIGIVALTGLGITFTQVVLQVAQSSLFIALVVTAMAGIVLGMGMPTTPAYIIMVSLLVPALIKLGAIEPAAHMFAFYFAILSAITPPVALAVFAAASLAKADLWEAGWAAVRIGAAGFIVPFMFVYEPAMLMIGDWPAIASAVVTGTAGCLLLAAGLHGHLLRDCRPWESVALVVAALLLIKPGWATDLAGFGIAAAILGRQWVELRRLAR
ncbi:MAG: TRAP transporter permease [Alphaproteobacteria bacterium]|nr:TRAP transporter permease [Alphaproteobacteria bacterium]